MGTASRARFKVSSRCAQDKSVADMGCLGRLKLLKGSSIAPLNAFDEPHAVRKDNHSRRWAACIC